MTPPAVNGKPVCVNRVYYGRLASHKGSEWMQSNVTTFTPMGVRARRHQQCNHARTLSHIRKRIYPNRGTLLVFPKSMHFRAMGRGMRRGWLRRELGEAALDIHLQTITWVANIATTSPNPTSQPQYNINVYNDRVFTGLAWRTICEPELFPSSRLIIPGSFGGGDKITSSEVGGAKINLFPSGKCVFMGRYFRRASRVHKCIEYLHANINQSPQ